MTVRATLVLIMFAMLPPNLVLHLRSAEPYRAFVRNLKLKYLPTFFAFSFVAAGLAFGSHILFNLEDAAGYVCESSPKIAADPSKAPGNYGLGTCISADVASCSSKGVVSCSSGRPVYCGQGTPSCDFIPKDKCDADKDSNKCFANAVCRISPTAIAGPATCAAQCETQPQDKRIKLDVAKACNATGIWVEQGQKYNIKVTPDDDWSTNGQAASPRGVYLNHLDSRWEKLKAVVFWPLTRNYTKSRFVVLARVGVAGNDEYFLEPDPIPGAKVLDVEIMPRRSGELFLYVNDRVIAWPSLWNFFYNDNKGTATLEVRRARL
jgi:hypothetical protein